MKKRMTIFILGSFMIVVAGGAYVLTLPIFPIAGESLRIPSTAERLSWESMHSLTPLSREEFDGILTQPEEGFVPDEDTAKKIAEIIWTPIYGNQSDNKPFVVDLIDNKTWIVRGTIPASRTAIIGNMRTIVFGRTPYIEIDKYSGTILGVDLL